MTIKKIFKKNEKLEIQYDDEKFNDSYDTIVLAIGRSPAIDSLKLSNINLNLDLDNFIIVDEQGNTNIDNVFSIGDVTNNKNKLTPVAIFHGKNLAFRLFHSEYYKKKMMDQLGSSIPTTIFYTLEYSSVGYTETDAIQKFGQNNIFVYKKEMKILQYSLGIFQLNYIKGKKVNETCFFKLIVNENDDEKIIGFHYVGPSAEEIVQSVSLAMNLNLKKYNLDMSIGIHPSILESITNLEKGVTKVYFLFFYFFFLGYWMLRLIIDCFFSNIFFDIFLMIIFS
jgi:thioredoxin reductase (NADPH)